MKISAQSWHMRLARYLDEDYQSRNLCHHFWVTVASVLFLTAVIGFVVGMLIASPIIAIIAASQGWLVEGSDWWDSVIASSIGWGVVGTIILAVLVKHLLSRIPQKPLLSRTPQKPPGLVRSYLHARKAKLCPMIEVTDE